MLFFNLKFFGPTLSELSIYFKKVAQKYFWNISIFNSCVNLVLTVTHYLLSLLLYKYKMVLNMIFLLLNVDASKHTAGNFGMLGMLVMLGSTICAAVQQLRWTPKNLKFFNQWAAHKQTRYSGSLSVLFSKIAREYFITMEITGENGQGAQYTLITTMSQWDWQCYSYLNQYFIGIHFKLVIKMFDHITILCVK